MSDDQLKIVIRGLPFEAQREDVQLFFNINDENLSLPMWPNSDRCKGIAFVECATLEEKHRLQGFEGQEFEAEGNRREISICDYEERAPRRREKKGGRRNDNRGGQQDRDETSFTSDDETGREVYVSNVSFDATREDFDAHFGRCGDIEDVTIPTLYSSGRPKGFAFVRFATSEGRDQALMLNESSMLDRTIGVRENRGRVQRERPARRQRQERTGLSEKPHGCTTIFVGNLPWSTNEEDLQNLFSDCGAIVNTRIVRQSWTNRSRGFGYVEFESEAHVDSAVQMQLVCDGRALRLDYAETRVETE